MLNSSFPNDRLRTGGIAIIQRDAPKLLGGLIVVATALQLYWLLPMHHRTINANVEVPAASTALSPRITTLFGIAHDDQPTLSSIGIKLLGTMAFVGEATHGMAIVEASGHSKLWIVGTMLEDAQLLEVYPDYIVIGRAGHSELIAMPNSRNAGGGAELNAHRTSHHAPPLTHEAVKQRIATATAPLANVLTAEPLMNADDQYMGLIVNPNGNEYAFKQLGMKPGDVIIAVNGLQLNPDTLQLLNTELRSGRSVTASINRPGRGPMELKLNPSAVTQ